MSMDRRGFLRSSLGLATLALVPAPAPLMQAVTPERDPELWLQLIDIDGRVLAADIFPFSSAPVVGAGFDFTLSMRAWDPVVVRGLRYRIEGVSDLRGWMDRQPEYALTGYRGEDGMMHFARVREGEARTLESGWRERDFARSMAMCTDDTIDATLHIGCYDDA